MRKDGRTQSEQWGFCEVWLRPSTLEVQNSPGLMWLILASSWRAPEGEYLDLMGAASS